MRRRDLVVPSLSAAVALSLVLVGVSPVQEDEPRAPDGRPALAGRGNAQELGRVLVRPRTAEEKELVGGLFGLEAAVELRLALAARKLRERGCMGFVEDPATETLTDQIARFDELASRIATELAVGDERARYLGVCLLDPAFGVRRAALSGVDRELLEVRAGLAIVRASQAGFVLLDQGEAVVIARRVDQSAALLRTLISDMDLLDASDFAGEPISEEAIDALIAAARTSEVSERERLLSGLLDPPKDMVMRMAGSLSGTRLRVALSAELALRSVSLKKAAGRVLELDRLIPGRIPEELVPAEIRKMSKLERHQLALRHATEGLAEDPFSPELTFYAALATAWVGDPVRSRPWFDRYLALRGIRAHDHRTYQGRKLEPDEQTALDEVQHGG